MDERLADRRVNWANRRREFFYVSPAEAKRHLVELAGELLEYVDEPEALEFRQSMNHARSIDAAIPDATDGRQGAAAAGEREPTPIRYPVEDRAQVG